MRFLVAHSGDWHFAADTTNHLTKLEKKLEFVRYFFDICRQREVNAITITGDIYDNRVVVGDGVFNELIKALRSAPAPVYAIQGTTTHDRPGSLEVLGAMDARNGFPIYVYREPSTFGLHMDEDMYHQPVLLPGHNNACAWMSALPTPETAYLAEKYDLQFTELGVKYQDMVTDILRGFGAAAEKSPHILLSHIEVKGSQSATGQILKSSEAISVSSVLEADPDVVMLGHIHKAKQPSLEQHNIFYSGSPYALNYGELDEKGFRIYTFDEGQLVNVEFIPTPLSISRPVQRIDIKFDGGQFNWSEQPAADVDIMVRIFAPRDRLDDTLEDEIRKACAEAHQVSIKKIPQSENRIRAPKILTTKTLTDEITEWAGVKNVEITSTTLEKVYKLESEVLA